MPTLDDVLPQLAGAKVFSLLDAKDGFNQVMLSDKSSYLTTIWGPHKISRWRRLPFELSSAPEEFQRRLQAVMHGLSGVVVVADDILISGKGQTQEEARSDHDKVLLKVFQRVRQSNLKLNKEKMRLHFSELIYIGHRISAEGVKPDQAKVPVTAIQQMPTLKSVQDVRRFLGMCNYLSRFLPKLSQISEPLRNYIIIVDYLSDFLEITELQQINSLAVIEAMKQQFARHGIPVGGHTDGGPQFVSEELFPGHGSFSTPYHLHTIANQTAKLSRQ